MPPKPPSRSRSAIKPADEVAARTALMRELASQCATLNRIALMVEQDMVNNISKTKEA
jgi:hypothetical protein